METNKNGMSTRTLALGAVLTALVVLLQFMGAFVHFGPFSISLVLIPIVIGAAIGGVRLGAWLGLVFGLVVLASGDAAAFLAINAPGTILTVLLKGTACGALAGLGGAYLTTCYSSTYTDGIVAGRGFIALAAVIFGRWSAGGILLACLFFGFCDALQIRLQVSGIAIPYQFFQMIPYVATVVVLSVIGTKQAGPKANGQPYRREQR